MKQKGPVASGQAATPGLSKNARKRLAREAGAEVRRERTLQKRRDARERKKLERAQARAAGHQPEVHSRKRTPQVLLSDPRASDTRVALDLSFDHIMAEHPKDMAKLAKQIERCYGDNRRAARPLQLHITSLATSANLDASLVTCTARSSDNRTASHLQARSGFNAWDVHRHECHCFELWPTDEIVYLCAESETVLTTLDSGKTYVIGGLVDHNRCKGLTHGIAQAAGIATARLPITEHVSLQCGTMLTVNHVFKILLEFEQLKNVAANAQAGGSVRGDYSLTNEACWSAAVHMVIPQRKRKTWVKGRQHQHGSSTGEKSNVDWSNAVCILALVVATIAVTRLQRS